MAVDDVKVGVVKVKEGQVEVEMVYSRHSDYVRGLAWSGSDNILLAGIMRWPVGGGCRGREPGLGNMVLCLVIRRILSRG